MLTIMLGIIVSMGHCTFHFVCGGIDQVSTGLEKDNVLYICTCAA